MDDAPADAFVRVMGLHSLTYCERLYYLEEVEGLLVADDAVYAGRSLHEEHATDDPSGTERRSVYVRSERLGLHGKVDAVRTRDGAVVAYEHKRGRARAGAAGPEAWDSDIIQVAAYAMLLEEVEGRPAPEGRVRYHGDNVTIRVEITPELRTHVLRAVTRAVELRALSERPPVTAHEGRCIRCSLAPVCLPEEERFSHATEGEPPPRLFPPGPAGEVLHVLTPGAHVGRTGDRLVVRAEGRDLASVPAREVTCVVLHGYAQISAQAIGLCSSEGIGVHWVTRGGWHVAALAPAAGVVQRRVRQYHALTEPGLVMTLARRLATARMMSQLRFLLRSTRGQGAHARASVAPAIEQIRAQLRAGANAEGVAGLRGHEGTAARAYFQALPALLSERASAAMAPRGRSRRPPADPFNAALSFGYALLYRTVLQAIITVGLEPALGFFHTPRSTGQPLVLDLMELFRVTLWDMPLVASCNRGQWDVDRHFTVVRDGVWLSDDGRKLAIELFERRLVEQWRHPILDYSLSYARSIELEVRLLEKEWSGAPGLFARSRLR